MLSSGQRKLLDHLVLTGATRVERDEFDWSEVN
jgi:hypothetical protein